MFFYHHKQYKTRIVFLLCIIFLCYLCNAQQADSNTVLTFNFNNHTFNEEYNLVKTTARGLSLTEDRFGNRQSAIFLHGHLNSYLNLGTSPLLKAPQTTISIWVNLIRAVYAGKGYEGNPIFLVKNSPSDDFYMAYGIHYDFKNRQFSTGTSADSVREAIIYSNDKIKLGKWYHLVIVADNHHFAFYINGKLQGECIKNFETKFLESDSVMIGNTANKKNERFSAGVFDDIQIFHRVLNDKEILDLYHAPNPNRNKIFLFNLLKFIGIILSILLTSYWLIWRRRRALLKAQEKLDLNRKLHELEIRTLKAQMNPHFIFNALNSIQQLIMNKENEKAEEYLSKFSKLIREILETNTNESITIKEEVSILNGYLEMESLRFGQSFSYSINIDNQIIQEATRVPHMMVQPFVENAIWHGLLPKHNNRKLDISFQYNSEQTILCTVEDNGVGRNNGIKKKSTFKKKSLALSFVQQRLELISDMIMIKGRVELIDKTDDAGKSMGTQVLIMLPILSINQKTYKDAKSRNN
jgi:hypothetical protein